MPDLVTLITCTGQRPEAFKLCAQYVLRQTYKGPIQWIVVDDFTTQPTPVPALPNNIKLEKISAKTQWREGYNTQRSNMNEALPKIQGNIIAVIEDDDWYSPNYLEHNLSMLGQSKIIGEAKNRYYNIKVPGYQVMTNNIHSSLASTLFKRELLPHMDTAINSGEFYFDVVFWRIATDLGISRVFHNDTRLYVGMKGLPGKSGLTGSHRDTTNFMFDPGLAKLEEWVGMDVGKYRPFIKEKEKPTNANPQKQESTVRESYRKLLKQRQVAAKVQIPSRAGSPVQAAQKKV